MNKDLVLRVAAAAVLLAAIAVASPAPAAQNEPAPIEPPGAESGQEAPEAPAAESAPEGEASVSDLTAPLGLSQPTVSHHLRILTEAGLLERDKRGVWAYYRIVPAAIAAIADLLTPPRKRATKKAR